MAKQNALELSDEEFLKLPAGSFDEPNEEEEEEEVEEPAPDAAKADTAHQAPPGDEGAAEDEKDAPADEQDDEKDAGEEEAPPVSDKDPMADDAAKPAAKKDPEPKDEKKPEEPAAIDYKAAYERITGTFQANGKTMKVDSIDDAIRLMQMGANYNRKMSGLKPSLKILKTLENAGISEEKLNHLIDLDKKDPVAIARLIKDAGLDPLDIDLKTGESYKPANHAADEQEMALDEVMTEIKDSPHYNATLTLVAKKWDATSKQAVVDSPQLLKVINDHMASGVYDLISTELEKERMFGRLTGMTDLDAYKHIGDSIAARKGFDHLFQPEQKVTKPAPTTPDPAKAAEEAKRKDKKRAASSPKAAPAAVIDGDYNPLSISDEEFAKQFDSKYK